MIEFERQQFDGFTGGGNPESTPLNQAAKEVIITAKLLEDDNHSDQAGENRKLWQKNRTEGVMHAVLSCGDARNILTEPEKSYGLLSIAAAGDVEPYRQILDFQGVRDIVVLTHFDSETVRPGKAPSGCGGLGEKEKILQNGLPATVEGAVKYVNRRINDPDPVIQSVIKAQELSRYVNKPILAATQDHRTGKLEMLAAYWRINGVYHSVINDQLEFGDIDQAHYNPAKLYKDGIPSINPDKLPDTFELFQEYALANQRMVDSMRRKYPDIQERLRVQNPHTLLLTTEPQPARLRYPNNFDEPGSYVKLTVPRYKDSRNKIRNVREEDLEETLEQGNYFITHAVENHDDKTKPFSKLGTLLIETGDIDLSVNLANKALLKDWMYDWSQIPEHHIIAAEVKGGLATQFAEVT